MARIGLQCLPETGHLNPTLAVGAELAARGHEVIAFNVPDMEPAVTQTPVAFRAVGESQYPAGTHAKRREEMAALTGVHASMTSGQFIGRYSEALLAESERVLTAADLDFLVVDQIDIAAHTVAQRMAMPFVTIALCLILNDDPFHPAWAPEPAPDPPRLTPRNRQWQLVFDYLYAPQLARVHRYRAAAGLPPLGRLADLWSTRAQISQQPEGFEFPLTLPSHFHFAGPFRNATVGRQVEFPWDRLSGRPLVYAAFGSLVNGDAARVGAIARACHELDVQLVIQAGLAAGSTDLTGLPGDPIVVSYAPQLELLNHASAMITHAGLNSVLECLSAGVPMVALPITNDEPAIAARIAWTGTGVNVPPVGWDAGRMRGAIARVLHDPSYRAAARRFQSAIAAGHGPSRAADIIERCLKLRASPPEDTGVGS
jgi:MGT family glycosyltransferase